MFDKFSQCMMEIWSAGPQKLMKLDFTQNQNGSPNPTLFSFITTLRLVRRILCLRLKRAGPGY